MYKRERDGGLKLLSPLEFTQMVGRNIKLAAARKSSDVELVQQIVDGDELLLEVLYDRYSEKVFYKCFHIVKDRGTAQDLVHDIMIKIFMNLPKFKGSSDFSFWVKSITYNYCMDYLKQQKRLRFDDFEASAFEHLSTDEIELEHKVLKELQLEQLEMLFEELKADDKMVLLMRYQDGMSVKQIAATLNVGESAVKMRLKRSRSRLAELLKSVVT